MARHLTDVDIEAICEMIDGWDPQTPLTWRAIESAVEARFGHRYTRQALEKRERVKTAYTVRNNVLKNIPKRSPRGTVELLAAQARIDGLKAENERLKVENERLLAQFARWLYNASLHGIGKEQLNASLPKIDRERTRVTAVDEIRRNGKNEKI
ncbi:hypothetical protein [Nitrospirillum bahiense]|uniref:Uncharacterized protein n=1 Tax=Nitrospirillum amazonense TaxID=28077 RepID=A0A560EXQ0_9PROT|nr:hypothetical protein [Nitrospirillum amazonense]TWB14134.1 hypothetical protein FBZ88_13360 [Nitrospirillum amazonense]